MRVCLVYDCLFPFTVGGAERWYRNLAERLAADGHEVTYLTRRQWRNGTAPELTGVRVVAVGPAMGLYAKGRRRVLPPALFGLGVLWHLFRAGRDYQVVHTASFPYFPLLAAGVIRPYARFRLVVDWHEVWTRDYWRAYAGPVAGRAGWVVQRLGARIPQRAFCFSHLHAGRLERNDVVVLKGQYAGAGAGAAALPETAAPLVVFLGRHVREKRAAALVPAIAEARRSLPGLRGVIFGDGPDREEIERAVLAHGLIGAIDVPGFVDDTTVDATLRRALCLVLPSRREGYGLVVVEAAARGVPTVVVRHPDNAATELVADGENGVIARSAGTKDLAAAILRVHTGGRSMRASTARWFALNERRLSLEGSYRVVIEGYGEEPSPP